MQGAKDKTLVVANKAEGGVLSPAMQAAVYDAYAFGFPADPVPISAAHNEGISELAGAVVEVRRVVNIDEWGGADSLLNTNKTFYLTTTARQGPRLRRGCIG